MKLLTFLTETKFPSAMARMNALGELLDSALEAAESHRVSVGTDDLIWDILTAKVTLLRAEFELAISQAQAETRIKREKFAVALSLATGANH